MSYEVVWEPVAEDELIDCWLNADNRKTVTRASHHIDRLLEADPLQGEHQSEGLYRICLPPLAAYYEIDELERRVRVTNIRQLRPGPSA